MSGTTIVGATEKIVTVRLTQRDITLLRDLHDLTVMSYAQVWDAHFSGLSKVTVSNRLAQLVAGRLIHSHRVGMVMHGRELKRVDVVFRISKYGIKVLQRYFPKAIFRDHPLPLNTQSLMHDLLLNDVMAAMKKANPKLQLIHGNLTKEKGVNRRRPDAIVIDAASNSKTAIELELSIKSERRYREIITSYRLWGEVSHVVYVTGNDAIAQKLRSIVLGYNTANTTVRMPTGKFYFVNLGELLRDPATAEISNGESRLRLLHNPTTQNAKEASV